MKKPKKQKRIRLVRFIGKKWTPYTLAIGQLALAWNDLHEILGHLFSLVTVGDASDRLMGVWAAAVFDRPKRELLSAAINADSPLAPLSPKMISDIEWILENTGKLENRRNDAVHSPLLPRPSILAGIAGIEGVVPDTSYKNKRAASLAQTTAQRGILVEFRYCRDSCLILRDFSAELWHALLGQIPWPDRPKLPNRGEKKILRHKKHHRIKK